MTLKEGWHIFFGPAWMPGSFMHLPNFDDEDLGPLQYGFPAPQQMPYLPVNFTPHLLPFYLGHPPHLIFQDLLNLTQKLLTHYFTISRSTRGRLGHSQGAFLLAKYHTMVRSGEISAWHRADLEYCQSGTFLFSTLWIP
jgi:hypothetical protein